NDLCTSTTCSLSPLRLRHYRWQCGSDTSGGPGLARAPPTPWPAPASGWPPPTTPSRAGELP
ncbi:MAG TPA: hypothetical protein VFA46_04580, partial [Actinomycetes bacterium]|nr:hypothetical protein [Actinomycetes bacterium]